MANVVTYHSLTDELLNAWHDLWNVAEDAHFFNTPEWLLSYCAIKKRNNYTILTLEENGSLLAVLPLVYETKFGVPTFCSPGGKFVNKSSLLMRTYDRALLKELITYLLSKGNVYLQELNSDVAEMINTFDKAIVKRESSINPYLLLKPDPFHMLSSKNKSQIRSILKKRADAITFASFIGDQKALEAAFEIDARSSKKKQGKATFISDEDKAFCLELLQRTPRHVVIDLLYYNNVPVVYGIGFTYKKVYHAFNTAFDAAYRYLRPGKLMAYLRIQELEKDQFDECDFGRGNSTLKQEFTKDIKIQYDITYSANSMVRSWWDVVLKTYSIVEHNKRLYSLYLTGKKFLQK